MKHAPIHLAPVINDPDFYKAMGTKAPILVEYQEFCNLKAKHPNVLDAEVIRCIGLIDKAGRIAYVVSAKSRKDKTVWILRTKHHQTPRCILNFDVAVNILLDAGFKEVTVTL